MPSKPGLTTFAEAPARAYPGRMHDFLTKISSVR